MEIRTNLIHGESKGFDCADPSRTQEQFKDDCDVNIIIERYVNAGVPLPVREDAVYMDLTNAPRDFGEMCKLVDDAREAFDSLPANVRSRFDNNPEKLIYFMQDEKNRKEAEELGLIKPVETNETVTE